MAKNRKIVKIGDYPQITLRDAKLEASKLHKKESNCELVTREKEKIQGITLNEIYQICYDEAYPLPDDKNSEKFDRANRRKKDAKKHIFK